MKTKPQGLGTGTAESFPSMKGPGFHLQHPQREQEEKQKERFSSTMLGTPQIPFSACDRCTGVQKTHALYT